MARDFAPLLNGVMWTQVVLAIVFIGLRMYTRYFIIRSIGWDDIIMVVNLVTFIGYVACISVGTQHGIGKRVADVFPPTDYPKAIMWEAIGQGICIMGIAASKGSVAIFLLRIVLKKWHIALLWFCIISTTIMCTITTILLFVQCKPTRFLWDHTVEGGYCWLNFTNVGLTMGAYSAAMDFVLAILPWHVVMGLNMKRKEKLTVAIGLSLGVFAGICSIVRTYELQALSSLNEYVYDTVPMLLWSSTEVLVTIVCACIPVLRPLYVKLKYGSRGDSSNGRSYPLNEYSKKAGSGVMSKGGSAGVGTNRVYMGHGMSVLNTVGTTGGDGNTSEESILRDVKGPLGREGFGEQTGGIKRTDEIKVTSYSKSGGSSPV